MRIVQQVAAEWKRLSKTERRWLVSEAMHGAEGDGRVRCKIVRNPAREEAPTWIAAILGCSRSQTSVCVGDHDSHRAGQLQDSLQPCDRGGQTALG